MKKKVLWSIAMLIIATMGFAGGNKDSGKIDIVYQNGFDPATSIDGQAHVEKYAEYNGLNPELNVIQNILVYAQSKEKLVINGQAGVGPDMIHMLGEWVPEMVAMGLVEDITDEMKSWEDYSDFPESTWKVATVDGRIYGIPSIASTRVLLYREDLLAETGLSVPITWDDFREVAKNMTQDTDGDGIIDVYGFAFCSSSDAVRGPQEFGVLLYSVDKAEFAIKEGDKWVPGFTVDQAKEVFQLYYDMMFVDKSIPPYSIGWGYKDLDSNFTAGTVGMVQNGSWMANRAKSDGFKPETWKTAAFPYLKNPSTYLEVKVEGIGKFGENKEDTLEFAKWLYDQDNMAYVTQTDNIPSRSDSIDSEHWKADPIWKDTFIEQNQYGFSMPAIPSATILQASMKYVQEVLYGQMTPRESAQGFYDAVKNYLDEDIN